MSESKTAARSWYATGKRKCAIARVYLKPGSGQVVVNGRNAEEYFQRDNAMAKPKDFLMSSVHMLPKVSYRANMPSRV